MNLTAKSDYEPWKVKDASGIEQTAGFAQLYDRELMFVTVKGAGHMVPQWKPVESLYMFEKFVLQLDI